MALDWRLDRDFVRSITAELLSQDLASGRDVTILDVRGCDEFQSPVGHLPNACSLPLTQLRGRKSELAGLEHRFVVVVSSRANRAYIATLVLGLLGFDEIVFLEGGLKRWLELGYPVEYSRIKCTPTQELRQHIH
jgi:rhodanese-related sulfurtransferase